MSARKSPCATGPFSATTRIVLGGIHGQESRYALTAINAVTAQREKSARTLVVASKYAATAQANAAEPSQLVSRMAAIGKAAMNRRAGRGLSSAASRATIASVGQLSGAGDQADEAITAGLLEAGQIPTELGFPHPLYRAAIYDDLSPAVRRGLHARAAAVVVGGQRLAHRVAAAVGPDEQLAGELESAAVADAGLGELVAAAWAFERSAHLSPDAGQRERRLLDAAGVQLIAADNAGAARRSEETSLLPALRLVSTLEMPGSVRTSAMRRFT